MRGVVVFIVFFAIFLVSSLAIPSPLFPGNVLCFLFGISNLNQVSVLSSVMNGIFYGFIAWTVFNLSFRWVEKTLSKNKLVKKKEQP